MPYVFQTRGKDGSPHSRWRFQFSDFRGRRRTATGTTSRTETEKLAQRVQSDQDANPLASLATFGTTPRTRRRAMAVEEITALLTSCPPRRRLCYEVAFASGLRAGELRALRVRHLDKSLGGVQLEAAWTKNRKP